MFEKGCVCKSTNLEKGRIPLESSWILQVKKEILCGVHMLASEALGLMQLDENGVSAHFDAPFNFA